MAARLALASPTNGADDFDSGFIGRRFFGILGFFGAALWREMGPLACGLAVVAAVAGLARRRPQVLPLVSLLVVTVAVHCLAGARFVRFSFR